VELTDGVVRLKPGYKFVRKKLEKSFDDKVKDQDVSFGELISIARVAGSPLPQSGRWYCACSGKGGCETWSDGTSLACTSSEEHGCDKECILTVITAGAKTGVILY
jgi:hypothetical protein